MTAELFEEGMIDENHKRLLKRKCRLSLYLYDYGIDKILTNDPNLVQAVEVI